jgi:glycosyltransferase involved in cell wall biosynthesis
VSANGNAAVTERLEGSDPDVSVIIPSRNSADWLPEAIASAASQERIRTEILIVDDGSTDDTVDTARESTRILSNACVVCESHGGVSRARNVGTRLARGSFIQYLDADDVLEPNTLVQRVQLLEQSGGDIAYCDWISLERRSDGSFNTGVTVSRVLSDRPDVDLLTNEWWPTGAVLYRRHVVQSVGPWNEDLKIAQDTNFLIRAASRKFKFVRVDHVGCRYRIVEGSLSRQDPKLLLVETCWSAFEIERLWSAQGGLDALQRAAFARLYRHLLSVVSGDQNLLTELARRIARL